MKILKLDLLAFGPFTNASLDLSGGREGLHVVYGPNEAGKSSSLRAITDFFFGIHPRTPDDFVHPYGRLRIGAQLRHSDGTILDLIRRKANQNSLRLADDVTPLDEGELSRFLGDVDRDLFHVMFGIDHERLRRGGEEIARGGGRIGELLFAAGAGIADLQKVQDHLQNEIDALLKASGRSGAIVNEIKEFQENRNAVKDAQVSVDTWRKHDENLQAALQKKQAIDESIRQKRSEQNRLIRIRDAVSSIGHWKKATDDLAALQDVPILAEDFGDTSTAILVELRKAEQQQEDANTTIATIDEQLEVISVPEELVRESDAIESLRDRLGGYRKAMLDRPKLETSRDLAEGEAKEILRTLGRPADLAQIEDLRLPADKTVRIQNLGNQKEGLLERLQAARRDCERCRRNIDRAEQKQSGIHVPVGAASLRTTLLEIQKEGDLQSQAATALNELESLKQNAMVAVEQLALWSGSLDEAEALAVPSLATVEKFDEELKEKGGRLRSLRERLQQDVDARESLEAQLQQLELEQTVPTKDELDTKRELRERGWELVVRAWKEGREDGDDITAFLQEFPPSESLVDAYHRSVDAADIVADLLRTDADRVATKAKLHADRDQQFAREAAISTEIEQAEAALRDSETRWESTWEPLGISPLSPLEMREWLRRQQEIAQAAEHIRRHQLDTDQLQRRIESMAEQLASALKEVDPQYAGSETSLRDLLLYASSKCEEFQKEESLLEQIADDLESDRSELVDAESRFAESEAALTKWQSDWQAEMLRLGLEDDAVPAQANSVLAGISNLFQKYQEADQFRTRIEGIDREAHEFQADVKALVGRVAKEHVSEPAEEAVGLLTTQLQAARSTEEKQDSLLQQRSDQEQKLHNATERISEITVSLDEMSRQAGCETYDQLAEAARRSNRRRELEESVRKLEEQIISLSGGAALETFIPEAEKEAADIDSLQPRIDELTEEIERLGKERDEWLRQIEREETELRKIDGSALAAEKAAKCESIATRLEDQVRELAVLRVSSSILHAGIEEHRKKNQGPVLGRASEIFRNITLGAFDGLRADFNERGEPVLTGVRSASNEAIPVAGMSDGTCDQLYLALRLASLESWLDHHEPAPFIVDDVLLNFDDGRAVAGLQALAELSRRTQVILFTHHNHLVEMAKSNLVSEELFVTTLLDGRMEP